MSKDLVDLPVMVDLDLTCMVAEEEEDVATLEGKSKTR